MDRVYEVSDGDREQLRTPRGEVVAGEELRDRLEERSFHRLITVGDRVSLDLAGWGIQPDIAVVDGRIQREPIDTDRLDGISCDVSARAGNPAGGITREAWRAVREAVARTCTTRITVDGEEDLLALPAALFAAPASVVVYGQRETGAVILEPDASLQGFVDGLVDRRRYSQVIVGGSWDRFHAGHRSLLLAAFARGEQVDVGITSDEFLVEKLGHGDFAPFARREEAVAAFLDRFGLREQARLLEIDSYEGTAVEAGDALIVTEETVDNGRRINTRRQEEGRDPLELVEVPLLRGRDGRPVSAARIRDGVMDRDGRPT